MNRRIRQRMLALAKAAFLTQDNVVMLMTPEQTAQFMKSEQDRYARLVKQADTKLE